MRKVIATCVLAGLICGNFSTANAEDGSEVRKNWEFQVESSHGKDNIHNYGVHVLQKMHQKDSVSFYRGLNITRSTSDSKIGWNGIWVNHGEGFGIGPEAMIRLDSHISGKLHAHWDFGGSFMFFNKAYPYSERTYGFMWRTGPGLRWQYNDDDSLLMNLYGSHFNNMKSNGSDYNTVGFSVGYSHKF